MNEALRRLKMSQQNLEKKIQAIDPATLPSRVGELEQSAHSHTNKNALDTLSTQTINLLNKLGVDANGKLTFNGVAV